MDPFIHINWMSPFPILGVSGVGVLFHFYFISNRYSCKQTVKTLIRCRVLLHLVWVCTVCLCPKNETLGLNGLIPLKEDLNGSQLLNLLYVVEKDKMPGFAEQH